MSEAEPLTCALCTESPKFFVQFPCGHHEMCLHCYIRAIHCYSRHTCYYCIEPTEGYPVVITKNSNLTYHAALAKNTSLDERFLLYNSSVEAQVFIERCMAYFCKKCKLTYSNVSEYRAHLESHNSLLCDTCVNNNRELPSDLVSYSRSELRRHIQERHVRCTVCNKILFDDFQLGQHANMQHHRCDICAKHNKILWFLNARKLADHMAREHYVCHYDTCNTDDLIAFETKGELLMHLQVVHHERIGSIDHKEFQSKFLDTEEDARPSSTQKNVSLMKLLKDILGPDNPDLNRLKNSARDFQRNVITPEEFYVVFDEILGPKKNDCFIPMLTVLPPGEKRNQLNRIHLLATANPSLIAKPTRSESIPSFKHKNSPQRPSSNTPPPKTNLPSNEVSPSPGRPNYNLNEGNLSTSESIPSSSQNSETVIPIQRVVPQPSKKKRRVKQVLLHF